MEPEVVKQESNPTLEFLVIRYLERRSNND